MESIFIKRVFILYWGHEQGDPEDCNIFYTESKGFVYQADAVKEGARLEKANQEALDAEDEDDGFDEYYTYITEIEVVS